MDNISGSATSQIENILKKESSKESKTVSSEKVELNLKEEIDNLVNSKRYLNEKYKLHKDKKIYDAIISVENALISLCN